LGKVGNNQLDLDPVEEQQIDTKDNRTGQQSDNS
jgi:hypothetical protein